MANVSFSAIPKYVWLRNSQLSVEVQAGPILRQGYPAMNTLYFRHYMLQPYQMQIVLAICNHFTAQNTRPF